MSPEYQKLQRLPVRAPWWVRLRRLIAAQKPNSLDARRAEDVMLTHIDWYLASAAKSQGRVRGEHIAEAQKWMRRLMALRERM